MPAEKSGCTFSKLPTCEGSRFTSGGRRTFAGRRQTGRAPQQGSPWPLFFFSLPCLVWSRDTAVGQSVWTDQLAVPPPPPLLTRTGMPDPIIYPLPCRWSSSWLPNNHWNKWEQREEWVYSLREATGGRTSDLERFQSLLKPFRKRCSFLESCMKTGEQNSVQRWSSVCN